jgi:ribosome-binding factor A
MATARRVKRLQQLILQGAAQHVQRELGDPRLGVVSITRVKLSPDLSHAQLFWSVLGDEAQTRTTERALEGALASIQRAVAATLQTRTTPRLELQHDEGMAQAQRLEHIFTELRTERGDDPLADDPATGCEDGEPSEAGDDHDTGPDDRTTES